MTAKPDLPLALVGTCYIKFCCTALLIVSLPSDTLLMPLPLFCTGSNAGLKIFSYHSVF